MQPCANMFSKTYAYAFHFLLWRRNSSEMACQTTIHYLLKFLVDWIKRLNYFNEVPTYSRVWNSTRELCCCFYMSIVLTREQHTKITSREIANRFQLLLIIMLTGLRNYRTPRKIKEKWLVDDCRDVGKCKCFRKNFLFLNNNKD